MDARKQIEDKVADYYNNNTFRFIGSKFKKKAGTIHRNLYTSEWPEVEPAHISETIILDTIKKTKASRILDLGCGIGASIRYMQGLYKADFTGITLSHVQQKIAKEFNTFVEQGSYLDPQWFRGREPYDLVYAIESLQHNPDHSLLFDNLRFVMKKGALLIIIDDFLNESYVHNKREQMLIQRFKEHWHAHGFVSVNSYTAQASEKGFDLVDKADLTALMKKRILHHRLRASYLSLLSSLHVKNSAMDNLLGGGSLIQLQQLELSGYYKLVFRIN